jgi:hypothetical protein
MSDYAVQLTLKSRNAKVGAMPVSTTASVTCPDACPLKSNGCYAEAGPLGMLWRSLSGAVAGDMFKFAKAQCQSLTWSQFCDAIRALPLGTLWRHNQAGDLPGVGNAIDTKALAALVRANAGSRGFTYTHKPMTTANRAAIRRANDDGFTINLSANTLAEADKLADTGMPVVVVLADTVQGNADIATPEGRKVVVCPATYRDDTSCATCQLCQRRDRKVIVGFPAHGTSKKRATAIALS